jgi:4-hydroxybenzoate polyprenyltransferase
MAWLRLIRWQNLLIIFLTQFLAWGCIVLPENPKILTFPYFLLLAVSTMLIAAAGYIINDYFDIKIDSINHPEKVILEKVIPRKQAIISHTVLNIAALILAGIVAVKAHHPEWLLFQVSCTLLLWFYSTDFKRQYVTGNLVVALLTSFTILALILYEPVMQHKIMVGAFGETSLDYLTINPIYILLTYAFFAFILTWMREIVKDMEDLIGDTAERCATMPIKWGTAGTIRFTRILGFIAAGLLTFCGAFLFLTGNLLLGTYVITLIVLPLLALIVYLGKKITPAHFHRMSSWLKLLMLSGVVSLIVYHYVLWARSF